MKAFSVLVMVVLLLSACHKDCELSPAECHEYPDVCEGVMKNNIPVIEDLNTVVHFLSGASAENSSSELQGLDAFLSAAEIVGMGEASHGTSEFFAMKDRLFRYMVQKHGYKAIGFEGSWGGALYVNQYVLHGIGSAEEAISKMRFWTWETQEVVRLVEWMKTYNEGVTEDAKIYFYGFDMQSSDEEYYWINQYLEPLDVGLKESVDQLLSDFIENQDYSSYPSLPEAEQLAYREQLEMARELFVAKKDELVAQSSNREYEMVLHSFDIIIQSELYWKNHSDDKTRDAFMAENTNWIKSFVGGKIALWAHNGHVSFRSEFAQGGILRATYGKSYKNIGFSLSSGTVRAVVLAQGLIVDDNVIMDDECGTAGQVLGGLDKPDFYVVFDELQSGTLSYEYFYSLQPFFTIGALFNPDARSYFIRQMMPDGFDVLIHFTNTNHAVPY